MCAGKQPWTLGVCAGGCGCAQQALLHTSVLPFFASVFSFSCLVNISTGKFQPCLGRSERKSSVSTPRPALPGRPEAPRTGFVGEATAAAPAGTRRSLDSGTEGGGHWGRWQRPRLL